MSCHHSRDTWIEVGYGQPVDDPAIPGKLEKYTRVFADSVLMMADCFDLQLDEVKFTYEFGACTKDVDLGWYTLPKGRWAGTTSSTRAWSAACHGSRRTSSGR